MAGHSSCDCADVSKQKKALVQHSWNLNLVARSIVIIAILLGIAKSTIPEKLVQLVGTPDILHWIPSILYIICSLIVVMTSRYALIGTCCIPNMQLRGDELQKIIDKADISMQNRIYARRDEMAKRLSTAITFQTISYDLDDTVNKIDYSQFEKFHEFLEKTYPLVHKHLEKIVINKYSLVYKWQGSDATQKPYLLTAHQDVVPCPDLHKWNVDPFAGVIKDGYVHGRGTIDDKHSVLGYYEAIEDLLAHNFKPTRTVYFAFGHDEERGGFDGAAEINKYFMKNLGRDCFEYILDEGLFIIDGAVPGHKRPIAFVCTAEKGYLSVKLSVEVDAGHASVPNPESAIGILSAALKKLEDNPHPGHFDGPAENMFGALSTGFSTILGVLFANSWFFSPLIKKVLLAKPQAASSLRTTTALTIFNAGNKDNVIPGSATATVNHRIHPRDSIADVIARDKRIINDPRVVITPTENNLEPAPESDASHPSFLAIRDSVHKTFKGSCDIAPGLFVANSDTRHYWNISPQIYRFNPVTLHTSEVNMFHGFNERISIENYAQVVQFFQTMIVDSDSRFVSKDTPIADIKQQIVVNKCSTEGCSKKHD